jgi:hypothetical protein
LSRSEQEVDLPASRSGSAEDPEPIDEPLRLVHHHPGYLRIRSGAFIQPKDEDPVVAAAQTAAETTPGFRSWTLNPKTGSVVVEYNPGSLDADDFLKHIAKSAGFRGVENWMGGSKTSRQELVASFLDAVQDVNQVVRQLTGERADLREVVPVALVAVSLLSFMLNENRGRLPQWSSALYRSYRIFMHWHRPEVRTRERAARQREERAGSGKRRDGP